MIFFVNITCWIINEIIENNKSDIAEKKLDLHLTLKHSVQLPHDNIFD